MRRILLVASLVCAVAARALAADASSVLSHYTITSWSHRDGLPPGTVWALAQDVDGYLWLGCDAGLLRFDGSRFSRWDTLSTAPLPDAAARVLLAHTDGSLWVGFDEPGGVSQIQGRTVRTYGDADGLPRGQVRMLIEDRAGVVWAGTSRGLFRLTGGRWQPSSDGLGPGSGGVYSGYSARNGDLLVGTDDGVYRRAPDGGTFTPVDVFGRVDNGVRGIAEDRSGRLVATDVRAGFRMVAGTSSGRQREQGRGIHIISDRDGNLWVATGGHGVWRVTLSGTGEPLIEKASVATGLLSEGAFSLLEDRDGNIWAGTSDGLSRLTRHAVQTFTDLGIVSGLESTPDGRVWVSTFDGLNEFASRDGEWRLERRHFPGSRIRALHVDNAGSVWVATNNLVARFDAGSGTQTTVTSSAQPWEIESINTDGFGRVWLFDTRRGLVRLGRDGHELPVQLSNAARGKAVLLSYADRKGRMWLTFRQGGVAIVSADDQVQTFGAAEKVSAGVYRAIYEDDSGVIWLGGRYGLTRFADGQFTTVSSTSGFPTDHVKAIVQDRQGLLWLGTNIGIVRIDRKEYDRALDGKSSLWSYQTLDKQDGVAGTPRLLSDRSATRSPDGRLWFVTGSGVTIVDPEQFKDEPGQVQAQIVGVTVDGQAAAPEKVANLKAGASKLEVEYSALNLTSPHKTRFRYRLEGFDQEWVYADFRRTAFYTNLPPGNYRFRVAASATGFSWNETGDSWTFSISPHIYQTRWFLAVVGIALVLSTWGLWRMRAARMRQQFSILLRERMRLSREIHDTLLQSMVGVALQCDALSSETDSVPVRHRLTQLRKRVEEYIDECRQSIWDLRSPVLEHRDLLGALKWSGERATAGSGVSFVVSSAGPARRPSPRVEQQLLRIAQEAIANAIRHAGASSIHLHLDQDDAAISLRVVDNGRGFDPDATVREAGGHCGLLAMRERAREVNGRLDIRSTPGAGAEVQAIVPFPLRSQASS